jgi:hypothetical protein
MFCLTWVVFVQVLHSLQLSLEVFAEVHPGVNFIKPFWPKFKYIKFRILILTLFAF